ncbi:bacterial extracellular solute-binding protein, family 5 middle domain-containing protein [Ditylenchus destructor]|nr:bacterial extracellular solute-binding protein, family 5 middle domain-containing protein [Ditylenchus destructor]
MSGSPPATSSSTSSPASPQSGPRSAPPSGASSCGPTSSSTTARPSPPTTSSSRCSAPRRPAPRSRSTPTRWAPRARSTISPSRSPSRASPHLSPAPGPALHHEQVLVRAAQGHQAAQLQGQRGELRQFQRERTGPFMLVRRQPGIRTTYKRNPNWWGRFEGNVQEVQFTPIANDATRLAALISGEVDLLLDPSPRDVPRLRSTPGVQIIEGVENRLVFVGMDQARDSLVYGKTPNGKNPFQDLRVRQAMYQAIDIEAIRKRLMNGLSEPTGGLTPSPLGAYGTRRWRRGCPSTLPPRAS